MWDNLASGKMKAARKPKFKYFNILVKCKQAEELSTQSQEMYIQEE